MKYVETNRFLDQFDQYTGKVKEAGIQTAKELIHTGYQVVVAKSPIWSGSYVLSHRIRVGDTATRPPTNMKRPDPRGGIFPKRAEDNEAKLYRKVALNELNVLNKVNDEVSLSIENNVGHALIVEAKEQAPYQQAAAVMRAQAQTKLAENVIHGRRKRSMIEVL